MPKITIVAVGIARASAVDFPGTGKIVVVLEVSRELVDNSSSLVRIGELQVVVGRALEVHRL